jgi:hypothetical protein
MQTLVILQLLSTTKVAYLPFANEVLQLLSVASERHIAILATEG